MENKKAIVAYVPVLHEGYRMFLEKHKDADILYIFGQKFIDEYDYLSKEIRALSPDNMKRAIEALDIINKVEILDGEDVYENVVVLPDEDVCRDFAEKNLKDKEVIFDSIFLRWDRVNTKREKKIGPEKVITENEFMNHAFKEAEKSSDWWRQVGAVLVKDGKIVYSRSNKHIPSPQQAYANGDPRNVSHKGQDLDKYTTIHCEAGIIADAAREGVPLEGAEMYVTDFPCPVCAKQIATAGIKKLYYRRGYAVLDGEDILKNSGVEIIEIKKATE